MVMARVLYLTYSIIMKTFSLDLELMIEKEKREEKKRKEKIV